MGSAGRLRRYEEGASQGLRGDTAATENGQVIPGDERGAMLRELAETRAGAVFICNSGSMEPTVAVGQAVRVRAMPEHALRVGDVVVYEGADGIYMLHRIVLISPDRTWFLHIGDAPTRQGPRRALVSAIVGRVDRQRRRPPLRVYAQALRSLLRRYLP
ncbi:MAG: hypothetical protein GY811_30330 [Myxococcales bacterium]|nr:hypothetical protein [Myxococcales bacterium]